MLPLHLDRHRHWELAHDRLKEQLQAALPHFFAQGYLPYELVKHTLELSRHLVAILLLLPSSRSIDRIHFWRPGFFCELWEDEINWIIADQENSGWGGFWADAHISEAEEIYGT